MNYLTKLNELLGEANNYSFENNSFSSIHGTYGRVSTEMQVWAAECEEFIISTYGKESVPWRIFEKFNIDRIDGNLPEVFEKQKQLIVSALSSCIKITPKDVITRVGSKEQNLSQVFIVHGHDEAIKVKVARFIEQLDLEPIILHEQASSGSTIIEKIEEYSNVGFGIVLYTGCDVGGKNIDSPILNFRARQNVVFEHGYLIGKIGRRNVCALVKGEIETPNDISGVVYVKIDSLDSWKLQVAKELKNSGYKIDLNKIL